MLLLFNTTRTLSGPLSTGATITMAACHVCITERPTRRRESKVVHQCAPPPARLERNGHHLHQCAPARRRVWKETYGHVNATCKRLDFISTSSSSAPSASSTRSPTLAQRQRGRAQPGPMRLMKTGSRLCAELGVDLLDRWMVFERNLRRQRRCQRRLLVCLFPLCHPCRPRARRRASILRAPPQSAAHPRDRARDRAHPRAARACQARSRPRPRATVGARQWCLDETQRCLDETRRSPLPPQASLVALRRFLKRKVGLTRKAR